MRTSDFVERHPRLFHMAADQSWLSIQTHGLLPTRRLVDMCKPEAAIADQILRQRRPDRMVLMAPDGNEVSIRDQKPLQEHNLKLVGIDLQGWLDLLNERVFFWVDEEHLIRLLGARAYRNHPHHVLTIDTAELVRQHADDIRLSGINSGATIFPSSPSRGPHTFQTIGEFQFSERPNKFGRPIVEAAVLGGIPNISELTTSVTRIDRADRTTLFP
jgi:hypothetical protein